MHVGQLLEVGGRRLGPGRQRRDDRADDLEAVAVGEVAERPRGSSRAPAARPGRRRAIASISASRARSSSAYARRRRRAAPRRGPRRRRPSGAGRSRSAGRRSSRLDVVGGGEDLGAGVLGGVDGRVEPASKPAPLTTRRSASAIASAWRADGANSCGSAPRGMHDLDVEPGVAERRCSTTSPRMVVVTTTCGRPPRSLAVVAAGRQQRRRAKIPRTTLIIGSVGWWPWTSNRHRSSLDGRRAGPGSADRAARSTGWTLPAGAVTALVGPNGSGKSTLLHAVAGLLQPSAGELVSASADGSAGRLRAAGDRGQRAHAGHRARGRDDGPLRRAGMRSAG